MSISPPALEDNEESVAGPGHVRVMWSLLHVVTSKLVRSFVLVPRYNDININITISLSILYYQYSPCVHSVQPLDGGSELLLIEDGEDGEDVLLQ